MHRGKVNTQGGVSNGKYRQRLLTSIFDGVLGCNSNFVFDAFVFLFFSPSLIMFLIPFSGVKKNNNNMSEVPVMSGTDQQTGTLTNTGR